MNHDQDFRAPYPVDRRLEDFVDEGLLQEVKILAALVS